MSVQLHHVTEALQWLLQEEIFVPTFVVTIFQGYRVLACSWEVGGRLYAVSRGGVVVALDYPLCHFELRLVTTSCKDAFGMDADRLEFRFLSAADRLDVACSVCSVPPSWLVVSRVSGPTLVRNAAWCRDHFARVESPDQALQLAQLAGIHAHWTASVEADREEGHWSKDLGGGCGKSPKQFAPDRRVPALSQGEGSGGCGGSRHSAT